MKNFEELVEYIEDIIYTNILYGTESVGYLEMEQEELEESMYQITLKTPLDLTDFNSYKKDIENQLKEYILELDSLLNDLKKYKNKIQEEIYSEQEKKLLEAISKLNDLIEEINT